MGRGNVPPQEPDLLAYFLMSFVISLMKTTKVALSFPSSTASYGTWIERTSNC